MLGHVFIDRSLGAIQVPGLLRAGGIDLTTMREHYGEQVAQRAPDVDWIMEIAERGWIGFCKDDAIRRNDVEREAVVQYGAKLFVIGNAGVGAPEMARRYLNNLARIERAAKRPGPFIYGVRPDKIERLL